jgi:antibiotic biosynthesis monooxygenase (ABM) superfamily enzyme
MAQEGRSYRSEFEFVIPKTGFSRRWTTMGGEAVTIVITRIVRCGCESAFEQAVREWIPRAVEFPGHQGALMLQPSVGGREYGAVLRFRSLELWREFQESLEYQEFLDRIRPYLEESPRTDELTGMETWFRLSSETLLPPRWKMAIVTWVGVCLTVGVLGVLLGPLMSNWSWFAYLLAMNAAVVAVLTWVVMPLLTRMARAWLRTVPPASTATAEPA